MKKLTAHKATAVAPANIAFIKYWGRADDVLTLPANDSISMNLSDCITTTTVSFEDQLEQDVFELYAQNGNRMDLRTDETERIFLQIDRIRDLAHLTTKTRITSKNSFPFGAGIASSASGFAALTLAATVAAGLNQSKQELSRLARLSGSGSACRSIPNGFVEWQAGTDSSSYARSLKSADWWNLYDVVAIVDDTKKTVSSQDGHGLALHVPYFQTRQQELPVRLKRVKEALQERDIHTLGEVVEEEMFSFMSVLQMSKPSLLYWSGKTIDVIQAIRRWRAEGLAVYATIDAGPNVHCLCERSAVDSVCNQLRTIGVSSFIVNHASEGAHIIMDHLF